MKKGKHKSEMTPEEKQEYYKKILKAKAFCRRNNITGIDAEFFRFEVNNIVYVLVHDKFLYKYFNQMRNKEDSDDCRVDVVIGAGKFSVKEIYKNAMDGKVMNSKGKVVKGKQNEN